MVRGKNVLSAEQIWDSMVALAVDNPDQGNLDQHQTNAAVAERLIGFGDYLRLQDVDSLIAYSKEVASFQNQRRQLQQERRDLKKLKKLFKINWQVQKKKITRIGSRRLTKN